MRSQWFKHFKEGKARYYPSTSSHCRWLMILLYAIIAWVFIINSFTRTGMFRLFPALTCLDVGWRKEISSNVICACSNPISTMVIKFFISAEKRSWILNHLLLPHKCLFKQSREKKGELRRNHFSSSLSRVLPAQSTRLKSI